LQICVKTKKEKKKRESTTAATEGVQAGGKEGQGMIYKPPGVALRRRGPRRGKRGKRRKTPGQWRPGAEIGSNDSSPKRGIG